MAEKEVASSEEIWAIIRETDRIVKETSLQMKETDRKMQETDRKMQETDRKIEKLCEKMGGIDENLGYHAEQYFQNALAKKLVFGGIKYKGMIPNLKHSNRSGEIEFDIVLVNGNSVALIEVKNRIHPKFVREFAEDRVKKFRKYFPQYGKYKAYLGIAGFSFGKASLEEAKKYGIGVIRQVGKAVEIDSNELTAY